ncbi:MAG: hypothetical protein KatS3mg057_0758 [Herpetosiphonaceae bacterium]|nr:MAG: hypothetical protein KatS3mg057_0758 [Herpetosiphonaceae bacterium]
MALEGDLKDFTIPDIIQLLDLSKSTGGVHIQGYRGSEPIEGWIYFREGKIVDARLGNLPPLEAALTFFTVDHGPFRFRGDVSVPEQPTITSSNELIIMEGIGRQDAWQEIKQAIPSMNLVLRLVPNPSQGARDINLAADEWRVLTMINGKNTIVQIAQRTGLGDFRTCEIVIKLLNHGLVVKKEVNLAEALFPQLEDIARESVGNAARVLLQEAYRRARIDPQRSDASAEQVMAAIDAFEESVRLLMGRTNARQLADRLRAHAREVLSNR